MAVLLQFDGGNSLSETDYHMKYKGPLLKGKASSYFQCPSKIIFTPYNWRLFR